MPAYLSTNVRILDGTGREPFAGSVRVEGNRIAEVTSASEVTTPRPVVKPGALADLLLADGDPPADVAILQNRDALRMIMKDGALHKAP